MPLDGSYAEAVDECDDSSLDPWVAGSHDEPPAKHQAPPPQAVLTPHPPLPPAAEAGSLERPPHDPGSSAGVRTGVYRPPRV
jgi:hypothetical protein